MSTPLKVLILEDRETDAKLLLHELRQAGYEPQARRADNEAEFTAALDPTLDIILADYRLPDWSGAEALRVVQQSGLDIPLVLVSGAIPDEGAVEVMKQGAVDYLLKDRLARLGPAVARALADRKKRRESLLTNEVLHVRSSALEAAANAVMITDPEGSIEWVNPAFVTLTGYAQDEAVGRNPGALVKSGVQDQAFYREMWDTISARKVWHGTLTNRRKNGSHYTEEMTITPVLSDQGELAHFVAIKQDITARRHAEDALYASERKFRALTDHSLDIVTVMDVNGNILYQSNSVERILGWKPAELEGRNAFTLIHPEDISKLRFRIEQKGSRTVDLIEFRFQHKDGSWHVLEALASNLTFEPWVGGVVVNSRDITEKKLLEEKFFHAQRLESLGMLAAGIAHDLNNVLAPIVMTASLLRENPPPERAARIINTLERSAERGAGLVKQILGFAKSASGQYQTVQIKHIARDIVSMIEETFPKAIELRQQIASDLWPIRGSPTQIHQVLLNLCVNARDAMPVGGTLSLVASNQELDAAQTAGLPESRPGSWIMLEVSDTGTGISPDVLSHIWEPFFTTKVSGTGLGLPTVRGIVVNHKGFVSLRTETGRGTTIRVYLPALVDELRKPATGASPAMLAGHGELVLVVEDDEIIRNTFISVLEASGYRAEGCADGLKAIDFFSRHRAEVSLVVTDVDMPHMGGLALARGLRQLRPDVPVVAMSGLSHGSVDHSDVDEIRKLTTEFLVKPFGCNVLLGAIGRLLHPIA